MNATGRTRRARRLGILLLTGLAGSQAGHLLAFQLRFGASAGVLQSSGVHAYFPALVSVAGSLLGGALLVALLVLGLGRRLAARAAGGVTRGPSAGELLPPLFVLQLALFAGQETLEALLAGHTPGASLALWGLAGQLPVAAFGALVLALVLGRVEAATGALAAAAGRPLLRLQAPAAVPAAAPVPALAAAQRPPLARPGRAPPRLPLP